jgi:hypothetical protein
MAFSIMICGMPLRLLQKMQDFTFDVNKSMFFNRVLFNFHDNMLTFRFSWKMFRHWLTSSSLIPLKNFGFMNSFSSWGCHDSCSSN